LSFEQFYQSMEIIMKRIVSIFAGLAVLGVASAFAASPELAAKAAACCDFLAACCNTGACC
jgi:hypothetical protein